MSTWEKLIYDPIHGYMSFKGDIISILDNPIFKRLQDIRQLGACYYVFPGASHNRFEHSLGVAFLAEKMIGVIANNQPELHITKREIELIKIAGLCHDLGHGPLSHAFDSEIIPRLVGENKHIAHEWRSCQLLRQIIKAEKVIFTEKEIVFIENCIQPVDTENERLFLYEIVSNSLNGIDVDKFDYLRRDPYNLGLDYHFNSDRFIEQARVIDDHICFPEQLGKSIMHMMSIRYEFLREICNHKVVKIHEYMISDAIIAAESVLKLADRILKLDFTHLTDNIVYTIETSDNPLLSESQHIINDMKRRQLYHYVGEYKLSNLQKVQEIINEGLPTHIMEKYNVKYEDYIVQHLCLGYTNKKGHPLDNVYFYKTCEPNIIVQLQKRDFGKLLPSSFCEDTTLRFFSRRNHHLVKMMIDTYGF